MAGVKGRSGGPRPNSGGARPGAGRKPAPPVILSAEPASDKPNLQDDPLKFLVNVMNDPAADGKLRVDAAKALMPFVHVKKGEAGKKQERQGKANEVASKFGARPAPLKLVNGK
jgi:phage terminase small subunit